MNNFYGFYSKHRQEHIISHLNKVQWYLTALRIACAQRLSELSFIPFSIPPVSYRLGTFCFSSSGLLTVLSKAMLCLSRPLLTLFGQQGINFTPYSF